MDEKEYTESTIAGILEELPKLTLHELHNVYQYISNPVEFELIDKYRFKKLDVSVYEKIKEKYTEDLI